jgi:hypothetical protein
MRKSTCVPLVIATLACALPFACGDDSDDHAAHDETDAGDSTGGDGDGDADDGETGQDAGDGTSGDDDSDDGAADGSTGGEEPGDCQVWQITYDLTDSEFEIADTPLGAGNQVNVVAEPHDEDDHVGPGQFVLRFQDVDGQPGGNASMLSYAMSLNFVVRGTVTVATDLETEAGPVECGITSGTLGGTTVSWLPSTIADVHRQGQILCTGNLCGLGGLPNGRPEIVDETEDQPISDFEFAEDLSGFTMAKTVIQADDSSTTTWMYVGTEVSRELIDAPACLCE